MSLQSLICSREFDFYPRGASYARVLAVVVCLCVRLFVCVSVTRRYCIKTAKRMIMQTTPRDSTGTLVFWRQKSLVYNPPPREICAQSDPHTHLSNTTISTNIRS